MASSTDFTDSDGDHQKTEKSSCFIHNTKLSGKSSSFTKQGWSTFLKYTAQWWKYDCWQGEIAREFIRKQDIDLPATADQLALAGLLAELPQPPKAVYHRSCYSQYTDVSKLRRVAAAEELRDKEAGNETGDGDPQASNSAAQCQSSEPPLKKLRSSVRAQDLPLARSKDILPPVCILCKQSKFIKCSASRTRKLEQLTACSSIVADRLIKAAKENDNTELLREIKGRDCVAIELKYHRSCYRSYTNFLTRKPTEKGAGYYNQSFNNFCEIVKERIIYKKEIMRLTKLTSMFVEEVRKTEGVDIQGYRSSNLKTRLRSAFPQLCFMKPSQRNQGEIVYVVDIPTQDLIEQRTLMRETLLPSSSAAEDSSEEETNESQHRQSDISLKEMYGSAQSLRDSIENTTETLPWPPSAEHLNENAAMAIIPPQLYNFISWVVGASSEPEIRKHVEVADPKLRQRILNVCQDVIYISSNGRKQTPKHISFAMTLRHMTGSAQLIGMVNRMGYCTSHTSVLEHDTALATREMNREDSALPAGIQPRSFATIVWDNNDFGEETLSGRGTTHNTNGIIIQRSAAITPPPPAQVLLPKSRKRSMDPKSTDISHYCGSTKDGPPLYALACKIDTSLQEHEKIQTLPRCLDLAYVITKFDLTDAIHVPSWTGFNQLISRVEVPPKSTIGYLPIIDASPTDMGTVLTLLQRSVEIADNLQLDAVAVVFDQAIYSKAQIIRWSNATFMKRLVLRLGAFHTAMSYIGCIGKRFRDAGLQDILIEAEVIAPGSVRGVMSGHHYNRAVRAHKLMFQAMTSLQIEGFLSDVADSDLHDYQHLMEELRFSWNTPEYHDIISSDQFDNFSKSLSSYISSKCSSNPTYALWNSYLSMVQVLLQFVRGTREGNWPLHLSCLRSMLPWMFGYDHINYARYTPAYWMEMKALNTTHPDVHEHFMNGEFAAQRSLRPFAQTACDQAIEQTVNRESKTKGGMVGFTTNDSAVNRWIWSHHQRAAISYAFKSYLGMTQESSQHSDLQPGRMARDTKSVKSIMDTVKSMINPFTYEHDDLISLSSGVVAPPDIASGIASTHSRGEQAVEDFFDERLKKKTEKNFFDPLKKLNIKTFSHMTKIVKAKVHGREISLKTDRSLLARLVIVGRSRKVNLNELLTYNLSALPLALATSQGSLVKTNKSNLMHSIEDSTDAVKCEPPKQSTIVIDGMVIVQQMNPSKLQGPKTFANLANVLLRRVIQSAIAHDSKEVHFVTDTYRDVSIKNAERLKRSGNSQLVRVFGQNLPQQWKKYLSCSNNKQTLIDFLLDKWSSAKSEDFQGVKVIFASRGTCHSLSPQEDGVHTQVVEELACDHEEADTRMLLHAAYAARTSSNIIICSPDTDVLVIAVSMLPDIHANLYFQTGVGTNKRTLNLQTILSTLSEPVCRCLIGLHCLTGCDSTSAFYGKGKKKPFKLLVDKECYRQALQQLGEDFDVQPETINSIEQFVCDLYGQVTCSSVNDARYQLFRMKCASEFAMPPNADSLKQHILRANYQAAIYKRSLIQFQHIPPPEHHGWKVENGQLSIQWSTLPPAPDSVLELAHCTGNCKRTKCNDQTKCSCRANKIPCTDLCNCGKGVCNNIVQEENEEKEVADDESEDNIDEEEEAI